MDEIVSESATDQGPSKPGREERDKAFSAGAGRKAIEVPKEEQERQDRRQDGDEAPVGLELETKAEETEDRLLGG
ncbi:MAG TPA: hypothetical protein V6D22_12930 [Candidatus Obscuribacterales bacterium]